MPLERVPTFGSVCAWGGDEDTGMYSVDTFQMNYAVLKGKGVVQLATFEMERNVEEN